MSKCIFCKIINKEIPAHMLYEDENIAVFLDAFPITRGHTLVVPKKHYANFDDLPTDLTHDLAMCQRDFAPKIRDAVDADAYNLGLNNGSAAGQAVPHVHWHIIPRYATDGLKHWPNKEASTDQLGVVAELIQFEK